VALLRALSGNEFGFFENKKAKYCMISQKKTTFAPRKQNEYIQDNKIK
jgi:hypothetical protein